jgi:hypothetical protein
MIQYGWSNTSLDFTGCTGFTAHGQLLAGKWLWRLDGLDFSDVPAGYNPLPPIHRSAARLSLAVQNFFTTKGVVINPGDTLWDLIHELSVAQNQTFHQTHCP